MIILYLDALSSVEPTIYWNQQNIQNYLRATIHTAQTEITFCFFYGPNDDGPLAAATDSSKEAWIMSIAVPGK